MQQFAEIVGCRARHALVIGKLHDSRELIALCLASRCDVIGAIDNVGGIRQQFMLRLERLQFTRLRIQDFQLFDLIGEQGSACIGFLGLTREPGILLLQYPPALRGLAYLNDQCFGAGVGIEQATLDRPSQQRLMRML